MSQETSIYIVRGGVTDNTSEYGPGVPYYDYLQGLAIAAKKEHHDKRSVKAIMLEIAHDNNLPDPKTGKSCTGETVEKVLLHPGQRIKIRGPEIHPELHFDCPPERLKVNKPEVEDVAPPVAAFVPPPPPPAAIRGIPMAEYPDDGSPDNGGWAPTRSARDSYEVIGRARRGTPLEQPAVAARIGSDAKTGGFQSRGDDVKALGLAAIGILAPGANINIGGEGFGFALPALAGNTKLTTSPSVDGRQGGDRVRGKVDRTDNYGPLDMPVIGGAIGTVVNGPQSLSDTYLNPFGVSPTTRLRSTFLPGTTQYWDEKEQRLKDVPNNGGKTDNYDYDLTYRIQGVGDNAPATTLSKRRVNSDYTGANTFTILNKASVPQEMKGLSDFGLSEFHTSRSVDVLLKQYRAEFDAAPTKENAQKVVDVFNYKTTLPDVIGNLSTTTGTLGNPLTKVLAARDAFVKEAEGKGVTDLDLQSQPKDIPIRSASRAELRDEYIAYYAELMKGKRIIVEGAYRHVYKDFTGTSIPDLSDPDPKKAEAKRVAAATVFVDSLPLIKTMPADGFPMNELDNSISRRNRPLTPFENAQLLPTTPTTNGSARDKAFADFGADKDITRILLEGATDNKIADAFLKYDQQHLGKPHQYGDKKFVITREGLAKDMKLRGYGEEAWDTNFNGAPSHGKIHHVDAARADLVASAGNPSVIDVRGKDLSQMANSGGSGIAALGAPADQLLIALAQEKDNKTYNRIVAHWKETLPADQAAAKEDNLKAAMLYAVDRSQSKMTGMTWSGRRDFAIARDAANSETDLAKTVLTTPSIAGSGMEALWAANPGDMTRLTIDAMRGKPEMADAVTRNLDRSGSQHVTTLLSKLVTSTPLKGVFRSNQEHVLSDIVGDIIRAQDRGDQKEIDRDNKRLADFLAVDPDSKQGRRNAAAFKELYNAIVATPGAAAELNTATLAVIEKGSSTVLSTDAVTGLATTLSNADSVLMDARVKDTARIIDNQAITPGFNPPPIPIPKGPKKKKQEQTTKPPETTTPPTTPVPTQPPTLPPTLPPTTPVPTAPPPPTQPPYDCPTCTQPPVTQPPTLPPVTQPPTLPPTTLPPTPPPMTDPPPVTTPPVTQPPVTTPPVTQPPVTAPPPPTQPPYDCPTCTQPPVTTPPVTLPPVTQPPVTLPPVTQPPVTLPPVTQPPVTLPPVTQPPVTMPPVTQPPVTLPPPPPPVTDPPPVTLPPVTTPPVTAPPIPTQPPYGCPAPCHAAVDPKDFKGLGVTTGDTQLASNDKTLPGKISGLGLDESGPAKTGPNAKGIPTRGNTRDA